MADQILTIPGAVTTIETEAEPTLAFGSTKVEDRVSIPFS